ncbi:MAG: hypothetical protein Ct9H300mP10_06230 [Methanobacteriota archaeon]|nr:MAG: hypothetical protein Ct9H300mP10_06230 [Euryarchaeota archaeon]
MSSIGPYFSLTKPRVVVLLQITALCSVLAHDQLGGGVDSGSMRTMLVVFVGGYLSAGGANAINMGYDKDIDPLMSRTKNRPVPSGEVTAEAALAFGVALSVLGVYWFWERAQTPVAAVWSAFSILFYVFVYSIWLKRSTPQNIVMGGIAGSTPPVIGWAAAEDGLTIATDSVAVVLESLLDLGSLMPWFMFLLIFLWTPPHFGALALYRSEEYGEVGIPMMPNVKGPERTLLEMKAYAALLGALSVTAPMSYGGKRGGRQHLPRPRLDLCGTEHLVRQYRLEGGPGRAARPYWEAADSCSLVLRLDALPLP